MNNSPTPHGVAIAEALLVGFFIPLLSSIYPIKVSLSKNLSETLDYQRSKTKAVFITVLQNKNFENMSKYFVFGAITVAYGIGIYYMLPLGMLSLNFGLILWIFFMILLGMIFGLVLLSYNL